MPSVSEKQKNFMAMSASRSGRAKLRRQGKTPADQKVAKEWLSADKGGSPPKKAPSRGR